MEEMVALGVRQMPLVVRDGKWVNGQSLKIVAAFVGVDLGEIKHLPPAELVRRIDLILEGAGRFFSQFPLSRIEDLTPGRPRSYAQLTYHLFNVVDAWLEHEAGIPLQETAYKRYPEPGAMNREQILAYGADVRRRFAAWWDQSKANTGWQGKANVYYGDVTRHEFLERTTWHSGQHSRQLMMLLQDKCAIAPDRPFGPEMWQGLPIPEQVWDS